MEEKINNINSKIKKMEEKINNINVIEKDSNTEE